MYKSFIVAAALLFSFEGHPQQGPRSTPEERAIALDSVLQREISNLTQQQIEEISAANLVFFDEQSTARGFGDRDAIREKMTLIRDRYNTEIESILSKEQLDQFTEVMKEQMQRRGRRPSN